MTLCALIAVVVAVIPYSITLLPFVNAVDTRFSKLLSSVCNCAMSEVPDSRVFHMIPKAFEITEHRPVHRLTVSAITQGVISSFSLIYLHNCLDIIGN